MIPERRSRSVKLGIGRVNYDVTIVRGAPFARVNNDRVHFTGETIERGIDGSLGHIALITTV